MRNLFTAQGDSSHPKRNPLFEALPGLDNFDATALEAIQFQKDDIFDKTVAIISKLRGARKAEAISDELTKLNKLMMSRFGLLIDSQLHPAEWLNAWVRIPRVDEEHPLYNKSASYLQHAVEPEVYKKAAGLKVPIMKGTIDPAKAKVTGVYSEIKFEVSMTRGLIRSKLTDEHMAAVYLHEIGHAWSTVVLMGYSYAPNIALTAAYQAINNLDDVTQVNEVLYATARTVPDLKESLDEIVKVKDKEVQKQLLIGAYSREVLSRGASSLYDKRSAEHYADLFVARLGGATHLAGGLDYLMQEYQVDLKLTSAEIWRANLIMLLATIVFLPTMLIVILAMALAENNGARRVYDSTKNRFEAIQRQQVELIKHSRDAGLSKAKLKELVEQNEQLTEISERYRDNRWVYEWISDVIFNPKQSKLAEQQRDLERLVSNPLFAQALKLEVS